MTGLGVARLCFSCVAVRVPSASIRRSHRRLPSVRANASTMKMVFSRSTVVARPLPRARSPIAVGSPPCTRRGPGRLMPAPSCDVTKTRSPLTMGVEMPTPAIGAFQAIFSLAPQRVGSVWSAEMPSACGPRQCGQSSARIAAMPVVQKAARSRAADRLGMLGILRRSVIGSRPALESAT